MYVAYSGFNSGGSGNGHVFHSPDGGTTWTDISGNLPDVPVNTLMIDPDSVSAGSPRVIYAGTDIGVFRTTVGSGVWQEFGSGLPPVVVTRLAYNRHQSPVAGGHLRPRHLGDLEQVLAMTARRIFAAVLIAIAATACDDSPTGPSVDLGGAWTGTLTFVTSGVTVTDSVAATLSQSGSSVTGGWTIRRRHDWSIHADRRG